MVKIYFITFLLILTFACGVKKPPVPLYTIPEAGFSTTPTPTPTP